MSGSFRTKTVSNTSQVCLYQLSLRAPVISSLELMTYTFPLSPTAIRKERSSLSSYVDTAGPFGSQGVTRVMDRYGLAPPIITIEGTTGWDLHSTDGYSMSGLQSIQQLSAMLALYADLNASNQLIGNSYPYTLEFYDYFQSAFWQIEPVGPQIIMQDAQRPLLTYYRFRWVAIRPAGAFQDALDTIGNVLSIAPGLASSSLGQSIGKTLGDYLPSGPSASSVPAGNVGGSVTFSDGNTLPF